MRFVISAAALALALIPTLVHAQDKLLFPVGEDSRFHWDSFRKFADSHDFSGQTLTVSGTWTAEDEDTFRNAFAYFEKATGARVDYAGSGSFEQQIVIDTEGGSPPDIAIFPQPGLAAELAAKGHLTPLPEGTAAFLKENYAAGDSWVTLGTYKGPDGKDHLYGFPYKTDVKSLVFYVPENFQDMGYEVPKTMEDLKALTQRIVEDGGTPWCMGLGAGGATGWPATDWVEDLLLRMQAPDVYDKWTTNAIRFDDPRIVEAIKEFGWFAKTDAFINGGSSAVAATDYRDSPAGLFSFPPKCYMLKQASFITSFFPEGVAMGVDADFFYFPTYADKPDLGTPVLGAGTTFTITRDSPLARAFIDFLKTPIAHEVWMAQRGFLSPLKAVNPDVYGDPVSRKMGEILTGASTFRFDGSDMMPGAIGAGAFWTGMVDFVGGETAESVARQIQATWDGIKDK